MTQYTTKQLLTMLVALIEVQIVAIQAKKIGLAETTTPYIALERPRPKFLPKGWALINGICTNIFRVPSNRVHDSRLSLLLQDLFRTCPSSERRTASPVRPAGGASYASSSPNAFWGDHPYADNRRQIIAECIEQLETELKARKVKI